MKKLQQYIKDILRLLIIVTSPVYNLFVFVLILLNMSNVYKTEYMIEHIYLALFFLILTNKK